MNLSKMAFAIYVYCLFMTIAWMTQWFADMCQWLDGTSCNDTETFTIRMSSFLFLYLALLSFVMARTNEDNPAFLKRLAFHIMYGLAIMVGSFVTFAPTGMEPKWYHFGDMVTLFILFALLHSSTSNEVAPVGMHQSLWDGHGANPRTFLMVVAVALLVKMLAVSDFMQLSSIIEDQESVTIRAETFYSFAICQGLALLALLAIPVLYGSAKDQLNTTIAVVVVEIVFGVPMFWGMFRLISSQYHTMTMVGAIVFGGLAVVALIGAYMDAKRENYDRIPEVVTAV
ncbi:hypothetical protein IV203_026350 [Nitzschia inconspicua]|uniref:Transmembrane protein n=1 Tax=Nitzschia inconspicua TaxID=303405 RepID=A0A9K3LIF9_9STRA|nr:hypothetical protein IV203_026350 [Nitzschia inconspicua]